MPSIGQHTAVVVWLWQNHHNPFITVGVWITALVFQTYLSWSTLQNFWTTSWNCNWRATGKDVQDGSQPVWYLGLLSIVSSSQQFYIIIMYYTTLCFPTFRSSVISLYDARLYVNLMQVDYTSLLTSECALSQQVIDIHIVNIWIKWYFT